MTEIHLDDHYATILKKEEQHSPVVNNELHTAFIILLIVLHSEFT
jgi:hypothetical protein